MRHVFSQVYIYIYTFMSNLVFEVECFVLFEIVPIEPVVKNLSKFIYFFAQNSYLIFVTNTWNYRKRDFDQCRQWTFPTIQLSCPFMNAPDILEPSRTFVNCCKHFRPPQLPDCPMFLTVFEHFWSWKGYKRSKRIMERSCNAHANGQEPWALVTLNSGKLFHGFKKGSHYKRILTLVELNPISKLESKN